MHRALTVRCFAKINWLLRIFGVRKDGFHDLETIFQSISLHDTITFSEAERDAFTCDDPSIPTDDRNLVLRAVRLLRSRFEMPPLSIHLRKRIPSGGGLGGGSSNAAAALLALRKMFALPVPDDELRGLALTLGSDVPFFLVGGCAYATGRGEVLHPLADVPAIPLLLLFPRVRVLTADAFRLLDEHRNADEEILRVGNEAARQIADEGVLKAAPILINDFEAVVFRLHPEIEDLKAKLADVGAGWAGMTGSGSTLVGAFSAPEERDAAASKLSGLVRMETAETTTRREALSDSSENMDG